MAVSKDGAGQLPWPRLPKDLQVFRPEQWPYGMCQWYDARASVARSLNRPVLPEIQALNPTDGGAA
jgi:hypothetical protein